MTSNNQVAFLSPGWPLKHFPNGIVSYIQYLRENLSNECDSVVLSNSALQNDTFSPDIIDVTRQVIAPSLFDKIHTKLIYALPKLGIMTPAYEHKWKKHALRIATAIESLPKKVDLLEIEESFGLATWLKPRVRGKVITRLHGPWFIHGPIMKQDSAPFYSSRLKYEGLGIEASDGVTAPSLDVLNRVREYYGIELEHAEVIPNPVPEVERKDKWQDKSYTKDNNNLLFVGRFDLHKGGDLILQAFRKLAVQDKFVTLDFVGPDRGVSIDDKFLNIQEFISDTIPEMHIRNRIRVHGHLDSSEIRSLRKSSTVTVLASRYENFPMTLLEALASGCPVVASKVGGVPEIIKDGFNGLLAEPQSAESLAAKVRVLLNDANLRQTLSENAFNDAKQRFSPSVIAKQTLDFYQKILHTQQ